MYTYDWYNYKNWYIFAIFFNSTYQKKNKSREKLETWQLNTMRIPCLDSYLNKLPLKRPL